MTSHSESESESESESASVSERVKVGSSFIGNEAAYEALTQWIGTPVGGSVPDAKLCKECVCVVAGASGSGKSHGVRSAVAESSRHLYVLNKDMCSNSKEFKEYLIKLVTSNVMMHFSNTPLSECILVIDDVETLLAVDRTFVNSFNLLFASDIKIPAIKIIMTCNLSEFKIVTKNLQYDRAIVLNKIPISSIVEWLNSHGQTLPSIKIKEIAIDCDGNLSTGLNMLRLSSASASTSANASTSASASATVATPYDTFPEVAKIYRLMNRPYIRSIFEQDPWLHPLRFHENLLHELHSRHGSVKTKADAYVRILRNLCDWDRMMANGKGADLSYAIEHATGTALILTDVSRIKCRDHVENVDNFTRMFNYLSLKKKNQITLYESHAQNNFSDFPWQNVGSAHKRSYEQYLKAAMATKRKTFSTKSK